MAKILIVDDRAINRECLSTLLGYSGYSVVEAAGGAEALDVARASQPDLVITDVLMPGMDGGELFKRLKADPTLADIPIIFYTAAFRLDELSRLTAEHANARALSKPSHPKAILAAVEQALGKKQVPAPVPVPAVPASQSHTEEQAIGLRLATLLELSLALAGEQLPEKLLRLACRGASDILNVPHVAVGLVDEAGRLQHLETAGLAAEVYATLGSQPPDLHFLSAFHPPAAVILTQPVQSPTRCYGWLYLAGGAGASFLTAGSEQIANNLATQLALAWENLQSQKQIANRERRLTGMIESAMDAIVTIDEQQRIQLFNAAAETMFGTARAEMLGQPIDRLIPAGLRVACPGRAASFGPAALAGRETGANACTGAIAGLSGHRADGTEFPIEATIAMAVEDGQCRYTLILRDVTERKRIEADLRVAATAFEAQVGIMVTDANSTILRINRAFTEDTGYSAEEAVGQTPRLLKSGRHNAAFYAAMWDSLRRTGSWQGEIWDRRKNGEIYPKWMTINAVQGDDGVVSHYVSTQTDITERKSAEDEIKHLAFYDPLTGLPNRRLLLDRLHQALAASKRNQRQGALLFIDLDNFKTLNDTLGHDQGDLLLQQVAQRLLTCVREDDTVARLGGDEFVAMLEDLSQHLTEAASQAETVGQKILAALNHPYWLGNHEYRSTPSIGVTLFGNQHEAMEELLKQADLAMYQAKAAGRNSLRFFDPKMQAAVTSRVALEKDLRHALRERQFALHYQAQVEDRGRLIGAEVLVRWQHPQRGMVYPNEFIALAEETGLILPLGQWVLDTACAQLAAWAARAETRQLTLAVNVSVQQLRQPDFVDQVLTSLDRSGADPQKLKLELTETLLMGNVESTIAKMTALKARGVCFALDDFGTGYSSLSYLKRLPLEKLKIDRSFVMDVLTDANDAVIAQAIVALALSLGLTVIAEGVETEEQRDFLARHGCHAYQGYLFSRPLPLAEFEALVRRGLGVR